MPGLDDYRECPPIEIRGVKYHPRGLGLLELRDLGVTINEIISMGGLELGTRLRGLKLSNKETWIAVFGMGTPASMDRIMALVASILQVSLEDLQDPRKFPIGSEIRIAKGLAQHPDLQNYFFEVLGEEKGRETLEKLIQMAYGWLSTSLSVGMDKLQTTGSESSPSVDSSAT